MPRILLKVALNDLPPVQRQDPEGKNTNGLGKGTEYWNHGSLLTRVSKTTSPGQSTETQVIHQKREHLSARQDLQGQSHKALQRAGKESDQYAEPSLTQRG